MGSCQGLILPAPRLGRDLLTQDKLTWVPGSRAAPLGPSMARPLARWHGSPRVILNRIQAGNVVPCRSHLSPIPQMGIQLWLGGSWAAKESILREPRAGLRGQVLLTAGAGGPSGLGSGPEHQGLGPKSGLGQLGVLRPLAVTVLDIWDLCLDPALPGDLGPRCVVPGVRVLTAGQCIKEEQILMGPEMIW